MIKRHKLFLFDMDGVLLDSKSNMSLAWAAVREQFPEAPPFEEYFKHIGRSFSDIMKILRLSEKSDTIEAVFRRESLSRLDTYEFFPQVVEVLFMLQSAGKLIGIVTSKDAVRTRAVVDMLGVKFDVVQGNDGKYRSKPAPDMLMVAMAEAGVDPSETIYVGDMSVDQQAARRAGCSYAHASWGYGEQSHVETLQSMEDLLK